MMSSAIAITFFKCPKHWSSLHWKTYPAIVAPKGITLYLNLPSSVPFLLLLLAAVLVFILALFIAHVGYLHLVSASSRWCSSDFNSSLLEQMVFALCCSELTTLYLDETVWLLSHWRYRSMCVGFLYTVVFRFPSSSGIIRTFRKGMEPSSPASSLVNWMCSSILFRCSRKLIFWDDCRMVKVSSTNLLQKRGDVVLYWWLGFQIVPYTCLPQWDL